MEQSLIHSMLIGGSAAAAAPQWFTLLVASCLVPFVYNVINVQVQYLLSRVRGFIFKFFNDNDHVYIHETSSTLGRNPLYDDVNEYLDAKAEKMISTRNAFFRSSNIHFGLEPGEQVMDSFEDMEVVWESISGAKNNNSGNNNDSSRFKRNTKRLLTTRFEDDGDEGGQGNCFKMSFSSRFRDSQRKYLMHIVNTIEEMRNKRQHRYLYSNKLNNRHGPAWSSVVFNHPFTFETLALDPSLKSSILRDLEEFSTGQEYYQKVGKPWKRGYLLFGPPGTGKSSLIAAIANFMHYNVYDLELSKVLDNVELRQLLLQTASKSVVVIEDIDCTMDACLSNRVSTPNEGEKESKSQVFSGITLSGVLNFCDGLWSSCGSERIFIFTTNHVDKLDPALLRKGRMDLHIYMSYCTFDAFKMLTENYLDILDHELMPKIQQLLEPACVTPAELAEMLLSLRKNPTAALKNVIEHLQNKNKGTVSV